MILPTTHDNRETFWLGVGSLPNTYACQYDIRELAKGWTTFLDLSSFYPVRTSDYGFSDRAAHVTNDSLVQIRSTIMAAKNYDDAQTLRLSYSKLGYGFTIQDLTASLEPILIFFRQICYWLDVLFNLDEVNRRALKSLMVHITHGLATWQPFPHWSIQMINDMRLKLTSQSIDHMRSAWTALSFTINGGPSFASAIETYMHTTLTTKMLSMKCSTTEVHIESFSTRTASPIQTKIPTKRSASPSILDGSPAKLISHLCRDSKFYQL